MFHALKFLHNTPKYVLDETVGCTRTVRSSFHINILHFDTLTSWCVLTEVQYYLYCYDLNLQPAPAQYCTSPRRLLQNFLWEFTQSLTLVDLHMWSYIVFLIVSRNEVFPVTSLIWNISQISMKTTSPVSRNSETYLASFRRTVSQTVCLVNTGV